MISPSCKETIKERNRKDPFHVLSKKERRRMEEVRNVNAPFLHRYALKALRRIEEKEEMKKKRKIERQRNAEF